MLSTYNKVPKWAHYGEDRNGRFCKKGNNDIFHSIILVEVHKWVYINGHFSVLLLHHHGQNTLHGSNGYVYRIKGLIRVTNMG